MEIEKYSERVAAFDSIAQKMGCANENGIRNSDLLLGIVDGAEVDSGTAAEIGFAAGIGKRCYGLRTDRRNCGDFDGIPINLQVLHFIKRSGGRLFSRIEDIAF